MHRPLILGSNSPRRQFLMREAGYRFSLAKPDSDETFPLSMNPIEVPKYLAHKKAESLIKLLSEDNIIMTADTVVILKNKILNKPADRTEALEMLTQLSGQKHKVITAVCLRDKSKVDCFDDTTDVTFRNLSAQELEFYVDTCKPFDKAGAYGAQDWIGMIGIEKIEGSYFTVMGLPMHKVYTHLQKF